jgi:hypothetical protein
MLLRNPLKMKGIFIIVQTSCGWRSSNLFDAHLLSPSRGTWQPATGTPRAGRRWLAADSWSLSP